MDRLLAPNSVAFGSADTAPLTGTPQYATSGNPNTGVPPTIWPAYQYNAIQEEIMAVITAAGLTPARNTWTQLLSAIILIGGVSSGYINGFRNAPLDVWQRGISGTITAGAPAYGPDGIIIGSTGANVTWAQAAGLGSTSFSLQITGQAGVTDTFWKQRIESNRAARFNNQQVCVQCKIANNSGASITPALTIQHPTAADNYAGVVVDVNAVALQACPSGQTTNVAYTFAASPNSLNGLEAIFDIGNALAGTGKNIQVGEFDIRVLPASPTGLVSNPPRPELRPVSMELLDAQRYLPAIIPGANSGIATAAMQTTTQADVAIPFKVQARVPPSSIQLSSAAHFSLTLSGANNNCTAVAFSNAGVFGATLSVSDTGHAYTANAASIFQSSNAAASILFLGAEL